MPYSLFIIPSSMGYQHCLIENILALLTFYSDGNSKLSTKITSHNSHDKNLFYCDTGDDAFHRLSLFEQ